MERIWDWSNCFTSVFFFLLCLWQCSCQVGQAGLEPSSLPLSILQVLWLSLCPPHSAWIFFFFFLRKPNFFSFYKVPVPVLWRPLQYGKYYNIGIWLLLGKWPNSVEVSNWDEPWIRNRFFWRWQSRVETLISIYSPSHSGHVYFTAHLEWGVHFRAEAWSFGAVLAARTHLWAHMFILAVNVSKKETNITIVWRK